jgi:hypothetical protein
MTAPCEDYKYLGIKSRGEISEDWEVGFFAVFRKAVNQDDYLSQSAYPKLLRALAISFERLRAAGKVQ